MSWSPIARSHLVNLWLKTILLILKSAHKINAAPHISHCQCDLLQHAPHQTSRLHLWGLNHQLFTGEVFPRSPNIAWSQVGAQLSRLHLMHTGEKTLGPSVQAHAIFVPLSPPYPSFLSFSPSNSVPPAALSARYLCWMPGRFFCTVLACPRSAYYAQNMCLGPTPCWEIVVFWVSSAATSNTPCAVNFVIKGGEVDNLDSIVVFYNPSSCRTHFRQPQFYGRRKYHSCPRTACLT